MVAASTIHPGAGAEKIRKPMGKAKIRNAFQPASNSTQPANTGISEATSKNQMSWFRDSTKTHNPPSSANQPQTSEGQISACRRLSRACHTNHTEAAIIRGPWPSCSVCQGPSASVIKVGRYAAAKDPTSNNGQNRPRAVSCLEAIKVSEKAI